MQDPLLQIAFLVPSPPGKLSSLEYSQSSRVSVKMEEIMAEKERKKETGSPELDQNNKASTDSEG